MTYYKDVKSLSYFKKFCSVLGVINRLYTFVFVSVLAVGCHSYHYIGANADDMNYELSSEQKRYESAKIRTQMAGYYLVNSQLDEAKRQLEKAMLFNDDYAPAYDMMGLLLQKEGSRHNMLKAEDYFKQAILIDPSFMQARNNYGVYLTRLGRNQQAIEQFEIAGAQLGYEGRLNALENLGLTALKINNNQLAAQSFVRILESDRKNVAAHIELVDLLLSSNEIDQARKLYNELLVIVGDDLELHPRIVELGKAFK